MKKIFTFIMSAALASVMTLTSVSANEYKAHEVKITVNGTQYTVLGYELPGTPNGIKIRTIATLLNGTSKQFNVAFDDGVVNIAPGEAYTPLGTELEAYTGNEPGGEYSMHTFKVSGEYTGIEAVLASDYNYVPFESFVYSYLGAAVIDYDADGNIILDTEAEISDEDWG